MKRMIGAALTAVAMALSTPAFATDFVLTKTNGNPNADVLSGNYFAYLAGLSSATHVEATLGGTSANADGTANTSPDSYFFSIQQFNFIGAGSGTSNTQSQLTFNGPIQVYAYSLANPADAALVSGLLTTNFTTTTNTAGGIRSFVNGAAAPTLIASGAGVNPALQQLFSNVPLNLGFLYEIRVPYTGAGSFTGTLTADAAAVPEPATWAMMLAGFGLIGFTMRRQRQSHPKVRFAF